MRALVLSGGGSKGAYEVGALQHLMGTLGRRYDIYCGVSVGALNCAVLAQFPSGKESFAASELARLWEGLGHSTIYEHWFGWYAAALWKPSLYDSSPLQKIVQSSVKAEALRSSGKILRVGAVDLKTGEYCRFSEGYSDIVKAVLASAAFPGMLTPVEMGGDLWIDGGVRSNTPIKTAIELGATSIDVVMCSPKKVKAIPVSNPKTLDIAFRAIDLLTDTVNNYDLDKALLYNRLVKAGVETQKRAVEINIVRPAYELTEDPLDFDSAKMSKMTRLGQLDAQTLIA